MGQMIISKCGRNDNFTDMFDMYTYEQAPQAQCEGRWR